MTELAQRHCQPCEGGVEPLTRAEAQRQLTQLSQDWQLIENDQAIKREFRFRDFYRTMSFVNALAHVANVEDHHPDLQVGYNYCRARFTTHAIRGILDHD